MPRTAGRPRLASQEILQEAAFELFQHHGYRNTSVEQIAKTAGFSRATFFNFFHSKSELFWVETDALITRLGEHFARADPVRQTTGLRELLLEFTAQLGPSDVPWALQHVQLLEATDDLVASGAGRVLRVTELFEAHYLVGAHDTAKTRAEAAAASTVALLLVALRHWVAAGVERSTLAAHLAPLFNDGV